MIDKITIGGRGCGKTIRLIKESSKHKIPIVCTNRARAKSIKELANELGYEIPDIITIVHVPVRSHSVKEVLVDDADDVLESFIGTHIREITLTRGEHNETN